MPCTRLVQVRKYAADSGYTEKAIRGKIETGVWAQGIHWHKAPDGHVLIDVEAVEKWARNQPIPACRSGATRSGSGLTIAAGAAGRR